MLNAIDKAKEGDAWHDDANLNGSVLLSDPLDNAKRSIDPVGDTIGVGFVCADLEVERADCAVRGVEGVSHPLHGDWTLVHKGNVVGSEDVADNDSSCLGERCESSTTSNTSNLIHLSNTTTVGNDDEFVPNLDSRSRDTLGNRPLLHK